MNYSYKTSQMVSSMFWITFTGVISFGLTTVIFGTFQGAGYTVPIMLLNVTRLWLFRVPIAYILSFGLSFSFIEIKPMAEKGIWWGMLISNLVISIISYILFLVGKWKKRSFIEKEVGSEIQ